jgi:hypothetical protein
MTTIKRLMLFIVRIMRHMGRTQNCFIAKEGRTYSNLRANSSETDVSRSVCQL